MRTIKILLMFILMISQPALAFNQKIDTIVINHENCKVLQFIVTIDNTDKEALWIWFDNTCYNENDQKAIRSFFFKRKGDFSIFDIATDPNMAGNWWKPSAPFSCFVKYLKPGEKFTIVLYREIGYEKNILLQDKNNLDAIKIFRNQQVKETCHGIDEPYSVKRISYPHNIIICPINVLQ